MKTAIQPKSAISFIMPLLLCFSMYVKLLP